MIRVRVIRPFRNLMRNERAGFPEEEAKRLIADGYVVDLAAEEAAAEAKAKADAKAAAKAKG